MAPENPQQRAVGGERVRDEEAEIRFAGLSRRSGGIALPSAPLCWALTASRADYGRAPASYLMSAIHGERLGQVAEPDDPRYASAMPANCRTLALTRRWRRPLVRGSPDLVGRLLPDSVEVVEGPIVDTQQFLLPEEVSCVARAVEKRRLEFACGRHFARRAMKRFGRADCALPVGPGRAPIWPAGLIGSIAHSDQYCAVAVARTAQASAIGIDVEQVARFRPEIARLVLTAREIEVNLNSLPSEQQLTGSATIFSAKESLYKCLFPLAREWLGFGDVEVGLDVRSCSFELRLLTSTGPFSANQTFAGRYAVDEGRVATALMLAPAATLPAPRNHIDESRSPVGYRFHL